MHRQCGTDDGLGETASYRHILVVLLRLSCVLLRLSFARFFIFSEGSVSLQRIFWGLQIIVLLRLFTVFLRLFTVFLRLFTVFVFCCFFRNFPKDATLFLPVRDVCCSFLPCSLDIGRQ